MLSLQVAVCNLVWLSSWRYNFWPRKVFEVVIPWMHTHAVAILIHWLSSQQFMITWLQTAQICAFRSPSISWTITSHIRGLCDHVVGKLFECGPKSHIREVWSQNRNGIHMVSCDNLLNILFWTKNYTFV